jgi:IS30 family transposase
MSSYKHFTLEERESLQELVREGKKQGEIAQILGKDKSSVSRELKRNSNKDGSYHPWRATVLYICRRKKSKRRPRLSDKRTYKFVENGIAQYWSPETIVERYKRENSGEKLSHSTIYRSIRNKEFPNVTPKTHLRRRGKRKSSHNTQSIKPIHTIHQRPPETERRERIGDLEGDTVYGGIGKGCLVTLVDRCSRFLYASRAKSRDSQVIVDSFQKALGNTNVESITLDNGSEFAKFLDIQKNHDTTVYFADPHSPWQRGSNENINGLIRFFFPKGTDFHAVSDEDVDIVLSLINNRPRKCLNWLSPIEFLRALHFH